MRRIIRTLLLALLCLACSSNVNSQTQDEAERNLNEKAKEFRSKIEELKRKQVNYERRKRNSPGEEGAIIEAHKKDAKAFLENSMTPSYEKLIDAYKEYEVTTATPISDFDRLSENIKGMNERIVAGEVTNAVDQHADKIISTLSRVIASTENSSPEPGGEPGSLTAQSPINNEEAIASESSLPLSRYLLLLIPVILSVIVSGAGIWWLKGQVGDLIEHIVGMQRCINSDFAGTANSIIKLDALVKENRNSLESLQNRTLPALEASLKSSLAKIEMLQQPGRARESVIEAHNSGLPAANHPPQQMTVAEYLTRVGGDSIKAKRVLLRSDSLQESSDGDAIYILSPDERHRDMFKAIPNYPRFSSSQDYYHYAPFYDCDHPSSGEVRIVEPALATYERESSQWRLYKKGKLLIS